MSNTARDTQFAGFAHALLNELKPDISRLSSALLIAVRSHNEQEVNRISWLIETCIAERAYDLVAHAVEFTDDMDMRRLRAGMLSGAQVALHIPDMTEFPKEPQ